MPQCLDSSSAKALACLPDLKYVLLDIDGVIWSGSTVIHGVPETLDYLRAQGKELRFLTNNASVSRRELATMFLRKGIPGVAEKEIYNSGYAAALWAQKHLGEAVEGQDGRLIHGNIFVVGERGLHEELMRVLAPGYITYGMELHDVGQAGGYSMDRLAMAWEEATLPAPEQPLTVCRGQVCRVVQAGTTTAECISLTDLNAVAVVVGLDLHFSVLKLAYASLILQGPPLSCDRARSHGHKAVPFIATNTDPQIPCGSHTVLLPGCGCMVQSISTACGRIPDVVCGKPNVDMAATLFSTEGVLDPAKNCVMVGDRLTTDIAFGNNAGCRTVLVLSGAEGIADVERAEAKGLVECVPNYIMKSLASFLGDE